MLGSGSWPCATATTAMNARSSWSVHWTFLESVQRRAPRLFKIGTKIDSEMIIWGSVYKDKSEAVPKHQIGLQSSRSMRRIGARLSDASALRLRFSILGQPSAAVQPAIGALD